MTRHVCLVLLGAAWLGACADVNGLAASAESQDAAGDASVAQDAADDVSDSTGDAGPGIDASDGAPEDVPTTDSVTTDASDAADEADSRGSCPAYFADCNGEPSDGCEVDTRTDAQNCGGCGTVCPGSTCASGKCRPPPSCKALLTFAPATPSGTYLLDPDGAGPEAPFSAQCDMTTAAGGWTLVFVPGALPYDTTTLDYTNYTPTLLNAATETLLAFRASDGSTLGTTAVFAFPPQWKVAAPFTATAEDLGITVSLDGVPSSNTLRYGYASFSKYCADAWDTTSTWGRICIVGSLAPFYNGFADGSSPGDFCPDSTQIYDGAGCTSGRQFTIGVR